MQAIMRADGALEIKAADQTVQAWLEIGDRHYVVWHRIGQTDQYQQQDLVVEGAPLLLGEGNYNGWKYEQTIVGWAPGMELDHEWFALVRIRVLNRTGWDLAYMRYRTGSSDSPRTAVEWANVEVPTRGEKSFYVKISLQDPTGGTKEIQPQEFEKCLSEVLGFWRNPVVGRDLQGDMVMSAKEDPSYEAVASVYPGLKFPREAIGVKEAPADCKVEPDGALVIGRVPPLDPVNNENEVEKTTHAYFELAEATAGGVQTNWQGIGTKSRCRKHLQDGFLPIVIAEYEFDRLRLQQNAFGWSKGMNPDAELFTFLQLSIENTAKTNKALELRLRVGDGKEQKTACQWQMKLQPKQARHIFVELPLATFMAGTKEIDRRDFIRKREEVETFWKQTLSSSMQIQVPEPRINEAWRAWMIYNFLNVDKINGKYEPHDGACFYEPIFGYSAALYCRVLDLWGCHKEAETYLKSLQSFISPDGLFMLNNGLADTGALLWAMSEHYRLTGDGHWLRNNASDMLKMCDWVMAKRKEVVSAPPKESHLYGLIKFRPYCDDVVPTYAYYTDTYLAVGMAGAGDVLSQIGMTEQSKTIAQEAAAYRKDVINSMHKAALDRDGMKMLPMYPENHKLLKDNGYTGRDYYSLVSSMVLESDFFQPDDEPAKWIVHLLENKGGLQLGMCAFKWPHVPAEWKWYGIDHAYTYGYWMHALRRGEVKKVLLGFYGSMAYGMSRETYAAVEVTQIRTGENCPTLPHLYSNTQLLSLLRNMLIYEQGEDLLLCPATPRPWLAAGQKIEVRDAPTKFGKMDFAVNSLAADRLSVRINPPARKPPRNIIITLRDAKGLPIRSANASGRQTVAIAGDRITVTGAAGPVTLNVTR